MAPFRLSRMRLPAMSFAFALFFPPVYIVATHAVLYDNIRHVLFLIPPLAVVAGMALDRFDRLLRPARAQRAAAWAVAVAFLTYHVGVMVALHPNEYIYLNAFVGGVPGGAERFDLDFWSNSLAETTTTMVNKIVVSGRSGGAGQALYRGDLRPDLVGVILPAAGVAWRRCRG